ERNIFPSTCYNRTFKILNSPPLYPHVLVAVGSTNPVKINAVRKAFETFFNRDVKVVGFNVDSGVPNQPIGRQTMIGALKRALESRKLASSDYGVGIEGGISLLWGRWYAFGFVAIINRYGKVSTGTTGWFQLPEKVLKKVLSGDELGVVMDKISGTVGSKYKLGAIGYLTNAVVSRQELYQHGVYMALAGMKEV
ncbi:MAG TPA: inosine/xanthosine triphosphatase, partial [Candidatus Bathyarchaeota archaeon]|nr:inosine/xanthosine triphosphatase [Candidatus Bathyarchaeota archaeon]